MKRIFFLVVLARPCFAPLEQGRVSGRRVSRHFSHDHNSTGQRLFNAADYGGTRAVAEKDFVVEFATALEPLPPIKKGKIVNKLRDVLKQIREKDEM